MWYTLPRCCRYAVAAYTTPGDVYAFRQPSATFYLSTIAIYWMLHPPHICLGLKCCHLLQYSLRFGYIACHWICSAIIIFYRSEIYCIIVTLCSTMPSVLQILRWSIMGLWCFFLLRRIRIIAILALLPVDITGSQVKPTMPSVLPILHCSIIGFRCFFLLFRIRIVAILALSAIHIAGSQIKHLEFSRSPLSLASGGDGNALVAFITLIFVMPAASWHPEMQFVIHAFVAYWVSSSDLRLLKSHTGGQLVKNDSIVHTRSFHTDDHGRRWVLCLLDLMLDCRKSVFIHPLLVALRSCVPGIHQECIGIWTARQG